MARSLHVRQPLVAGGGSAACANRVNNTFDKLLECVTLDGVRRRQAALQAIADANNGIRTSGMPGYTASVEYAKGVFEQAGDAVTVQSFDLQIFITLSPTALEQISPSPAGRLVNNMMSYSGSGDVTAAVSTVSAITGCNAADFAGFPVGQQFAATPGLVMRLKTDTFRGTATSDNVLAESKNGDGNTVVVVGAYPDSVPTVSALAPSPAGRMSSRRCSMSTT